MDKSNECSHIDMSLRAKRLICDFNNPHRYRITSDLQSLSINLDLYYSKFENTIVLGNSNATLEETALKNFCETFNLKKKLVKEPTCFKNPNIPSSIGLILTNKIRSFQNSSTVTTGLSGLHKIIVSALKLQLHKLVPRVVS